MKNYYHILGIDRFASIQEIKRSYRRLVLQYHPDKNSGNNLYAEKFIEIREAYETLSDNFKRQVYDDWYFATTVSQMAYEPAQPRTHFVRRDVPMDKRDKQIFYGGIALFFILAMFLYFAFVQGIINDEQTNAYTDWSIRDPNGNERRLTQIQFDSLLRCYNLQPGHVADLIDSLQQVKN